MTAATLPLRGLAAREPVTLDELNRTAALLTRVDRKYVLTSAEADAFILGLPREARVLDIDGRRRFGYHSTYFDTAGLDCFLGTAHRRRHRFKVRTRRYVDTDQQFLEVKTRRGGCTVKRRVAWEQPIRHLDGGAREFVADHGRAPTPREMIQLAQQANLATRQDKHEPRSLAEQRDSWRDQAIAIQSLPSSHSRSQGEASAVDRPGPPSTP